MTDQELLESVAEAASDYVLSVNVPGFADEHGGEHNLYHSLEVAVKKYENRQSNIIPKDEQL